MPMAGQDELIDAIAVSGCSPTCRRRSSRRSSTFDEVAYAEGERVLRQA